MANNPNEGMTPVINERNPKTGKYEMKVIGTGEVLDTSDTPWGIMEKTQAENGRRGIGTKGLPGNSFNEMEPGVDPTYPLRMGTDQILVSQSGDNTGVDGSGNTMWNGKAQTFNNIGQDGKPNASSR